MKSDVPLNVRVSVLSECAEGNGTTKKVFHQKSLVTEGDVMRCKYFFCNSYSVEDFKIDLIFLNGPIHLLAYIRCIL